MRGQAFTAMKLVQGAIVALVLLGIIYGGLQLVKQYEPGSDVLTISADLLSSAYEAAGTGQSFTRKAKLKPQFITSEAVKNKAGLNDPNLVVKFECKIPVARDVQGNDCQPDEQYSEIQLKSGTEIDVCAYCDSVEKCTIVLGAKEC